MLLAGVDVGGTDIEVGLVDAEHQVLARAKRDTPDGGPDAVIATIVELIAFLDETPVAVGTGIPGVIHDGRALTVLNLENWVDQVDIGTELEQALGVPVASATTSTSACWASGWRAPRTASTTSSGCGWAPASAVA